MNGFLVMEQYSILLLIELPASNTQRFSLRTSRLGVSLKFQDASDRLF
jgi:hypothetical protein